MTNTYSRSSFCSIFYNWESSRGPQEKLLRAVCCAGLIYILSVWTAHADAFDFVIDWLTFWIACCVESAASSCKRASCLLLSCAYLEKQVFLSEKAIIWLRGTFLKIRRSIAMRYKKMQKYKHLLVSKVFRCFLPRQWQLKSFPKCPCTQLG